MKKVSLLSLVLASFIMVGCDSSSSSSDSNNTNSDGSSTTTTPITPLTCSATTGTFTIESGTNGDITYSCKFDELYGYHLADGISSLNVVDVKIEENVQVTCTDGSGSYEAITNFAAKTVDYKGSSPSIGTVECRETYIDDRLPGVLSTQESIDELLHWKQVSSKDDARLASTTCPDSFYEDKEDEDDEGGDDSCSGSVIANYTVTDDSGKKHLIAFSNKF